ncbi:MAG: hypothetical protein QG670_1364 [Thermoproteota archaeon]|nr:hypothetical protein [Thermoproteota archaeon]
MADNKYRVFIGPKTSPRGAIFFLIITTITMIMFVDSTTTRMESIYIMIPIMYVIVIFFGIMALLGVTHRLVYELQDSTLVIRQALETEKIPYSNIESAQLDETTRRGITTYLSSRLKPWSPTSKALSKLTIASLQVGMNLTGGSVPCISIKLKNNRTWLIVFPENREKEFYNTLLKHLENNKKRKG